MTTSNSADAELLLHIIPDGADAELLLHIISDGAAAELLLHFCPPTLQEEHRSTYPPPHPAYNPLFNH